MSLSQMQSAVVPLLLAFIWLGLTLAALYVLRRDTTRTESEKAVWTLIILIPIVGAWAFLFINAGRRNKTDFDRD